ncbi:MAG: M56 family metallopeptidase [Solirubrobacteraceae bacterium]
MTDARRVFLLQAGVVIVGAAVTLVALLVAASRVRLDGRVFQDTCAALLSGHDLRATAVLTLGGLALLVIGRTGWMLARLGIAHQRTCRELRYEGRHRGALVVAGAGPRAFCAGLLSPEVYVTAGAVALLGDDELDRVIAHERHHAARRDPLRAIAARSAAYGLFFLPVLRDLQDEYTRLAEIAADEAAASRPDDRRALAAALLVFDRCGAGIEPERVDHLCGLRARADVPLRPMAAAIMTSGVVLAASVVALSTAAADSIALLTVTPHAVLIFAVGAALVNGIDWALRRRGGAARIR